MNWFKVLGYSTSLYLMQVISVALAVYLGATSGIDNPHRNPLLIAVTAAIGVLVYFLLAKSQFEKNYKYAVSVFCLYWGISFIVVLVMEYLLISYSYSLDSFAMDISVSSSTLFLGTYVGIKYRAYRNGNRYVT